MIQARILSAGPGDVLEAQLTAVGIRQEDARAISLAGTNRCIVITGLPTDGVILLEKLSDNLAQVALGESCIALLGSETWLHQTAQRYLAQGQPILRAVGAEIERVLANSAILTPPTMVVRGRNLRWGERTYIMGIVNVTPDSFSGDGLLRSEMSAADAAEQAVKQGLAFEEQGADMLDIGGESSRPGSEPVDAVTELERILPAINGIRQVSDIPISVDTTKAEVAAAALDAGADMINDISALQVDPQMAPLASDRHAPVILMHRRSNDAAALQRGSLGGHFTTSGLTYHSLAMMIGDVLQGLGEAIERAQQAGIARELLIIDPGIGFGKAREENLYLVNHLDELKSLGLPILLGVSRKAFIGYTLNTTVYDRKEGTAAAICIGIARGADIVRVHDVTEMVRVARMTDALVRFKPQ